MDGLCEVSFVPSMFISFTSMKIGFSFLQVPFFMCVLKRIEIDGRGRDSRGDPEAILVFFSFVSLSN